MTQHKVAIIMGSKSDWPVMRHAATVLEQFEIPFEAMVVSAHRTPERLYEFAQSAEQTTTSSLLAQEEPLIFQE